MRMVLGGGPRHGARANLGQGTDAAATATASGPRTLTFLFSIFAALVAAFAFSGPASASVDEGATPPTISSDKADYAPGELVTLRGSNWQPGETVNIDVNDDQTASWRRNVDVVADADGNIVDSFHLPDWFVATYQVVATGAVSGTALTSFTDGNIKVSFSGAPFDYDAILYDGSGCAGTAKKTDLGVTATAGGITHGVGSSESLKIVANANANAPNSSFVFKDWTNPDGLSISPNLTTRTICIAGFQSGNRELTGNYVGNTAPVAVNESYALNEDAVLTVSAQGVLANDTDANGNPLTVATPRPVSGPSNGTLTLNANGSFTYTPNANFFGTESFTYRANDGYANSNLATVTITVTAVDDSPVAVADAATVAEDSGATTIDVRANDTDIDGGPKTIQSVTQPANGTVAITNAGSNLTYTPNANSCDGGFPAGTFTYSLNGGSTATVSVTVTCVNDAPVAVDDSATTAEDTAVAKNMISNDTDVDTTNAPLSVKPGSLTATNGSATLEPDGRTIRFTPAANLNNGNVGPAGFTVNYRATDGTLDSDLATLTISVTAVNDAPVVAADDASATVSEGQTAANTGTSSDIDAGDNLTLTASVGTVVTNLDGTWSWSFPTSDGPDDSQTVTITAVDAAGGTDSATFALTVNNVAPSVSLAAGNDLSVDEGSQHTYAFTVTDPGADAFSVVSVSCSANGGQIGTTTTNVGGGSFVCSFPDGPARSIVSVQVGDSDGADSNTATQTVTVANVAPTVALTGDNAADEGSTHTYSYTATDPGGDTLTFTESCGADGTRVDTAAANSFDCTFPAGPASSTVTVSANDGDATGSDSITVAVANVAPTVTLAGLALVNEGSTHTYSFTVSDPGNDTFAVSATECGTGGSQVGADTFDSTTGAGSFDCSFPDGPAGPTVSVTVSDSDDASNSDTVAVTVNNVSPTVTLSASNDLSVDEGESRTYMYSISDPGDDTVQAVSTSCGDNGTKTFLSDNRNNTSGSFGCTFRDGSATSTISAQATDDDGASGNTDTQTVSIVNVAPTVTLTGQATAAEGSTHTYSFTVTDPGDDTFALGATDCGTGGSQLGTDTFDASTGTGSFACRFPDGPASGSVSVTVSDSDGASDSDTLAVTVDNVKPSIVQTGAAAANEGETKTYTYTVTDPGVDTHTIATNCGLNGAKVWGSETYDAGTGEGSFRCFFADGPATTNVTATVTDSDGASDTDNQVVVVTIANVPPTVTLSGASSANEGDSKHYMFTTSDPGEDTFVLDGVDCGAAGTLDAPAFNATTGAGSFDCAFPDGTVTSSVSVTVEDSDGGSDSDSMTVSIANVPPTVVLTGDDAADEGRTKTYTYTATDPGADTLTYIESCGGNGTRVDTAAANSFDCTFPDGPASSSVSVTAEDSDGGSDSDSITVSIANVAPTITLAAGNDLSVNEGSQHTSSFTVSDPGNDTFSVVSVSCGANGSQVGSTTTTASGGSFVCSFPDGPASSTVSVQVKDSDDANSETANQTVAIANVGPTVTLTGDATVAEGSTHTYSFTVSDPGNDTFAVSATECGTGGNQVGPDTFDGATGAGSFDCSFPDGPAGPTVSVTVSDHDGASDSNTVAVTVNNVAPTVTLTGQGTVDEGSSHTYGFTTSDPGADTFVLDATECGTGGSQVGADTFNPTTGRGSFVCRLPDGPAGPTVSVTVSDSDGASDSDTVGVTVNNVVPTATIATIAGASATSPEGTPISVTGTYTDAGSADTHSQAWSVTKDGVAYGNGGSGASFSFTPDDNGTYVLTYTVTDDDGGVGSDSETVTVTNVAPTLTSLTASSYAVAVGTAVTVTGEYTDSSSADTFTCVIGWDDGGSPENVSRPAGSTSCQATKTFAATGVYSVTMKVIDDDGVESNTLTAIIAVFDPNVGHVTGGGWINSPLDAYLPDPTLTGRANFGFNAKYQKGAKTPSGSTEFQFKAGNLNFHSTNYEWLVVSGAKGQFKGTGAINGAGNYGFLLTVTDGQLTGGGGTDKFRMKIWDKNAAEAIVYDNASTGGDDIDSSRTQDIAGGSIVIHKGK